MDTTPPHSEPSAPDFRLLFESAPGSYLVLTPDLTIVAASTAYVSATMTRRADLLGRHLFDVFPDNPDDPAASGVRNLRASLDHVRDSGAPDVMAVQRYDVRRPESAGGEFETRFWSPINSPVFGAGGDIAYIIHRVEDVTEFMRLNQLEGEREQQTEALRIRAERMEADVFLRSQEVADANRRLSKANADLEAANAEWESFSYAVSHDLRAPLRAIDGFSQALLEDWSGALDQKGQHYLRRVRGAAQRMAALIDDLLDLSRVSRAELRRERVDFSGLARMVLSDLEHAEPERRVESIVDPGVEVEGDPRLLRVILDNLLGNAWKFTSRTSRPVVRFGRGWRDGQSTFYVRDNGAGFDPAYAARFFAPFQRLHTEHEFAGTGIGLATVQRIIHRHGGHVWAEGAVGHGATFTWTLPSVSEGGSREA
jgi:signal transduction histidine kinase